MGEESDKAEAQALIDMGERLVDTVREVGMSPAQSIVIFVAAIRACVRQTDADEAGKAELVSDAWNMVGLERRAA